MSSPGWGLWPGVRAELFLRLIISVSRPQVGRGGLSDSGLLNTYSKSVVILNLIQRALGFLGVLFFRFFFHFFSLSAGRRMLRHLHSSPQLPCWEGRNPLSSAVTLHRLPAAGQALPSHSIPSPRALCSGQARPSSPAKEQLPTQTDVPVFQSPPNHSFLACTFSDLERKQNNSYCHVRE